MNPHDKHTQDRCGTDPVGSFRTEATESEVIVHGLLTDFDPNDIILEVHDGELWIDALNVKGQENRKFSQRIPLPAGVAPGRVQGTFINGALQVRLPRQQQPTGR